MARAEARGAFFLSSGIDDRHGDPGGAGARTAVPVAGWIGVIAGGRGVVGNADGANGGRVGRAVEDDGGSGSAGDDYLGAAEESGVSYQIALGYSAFIR